MKMISTIKRKTRKMTNKPKKNPSKLPLNPFQTLKLPLRKKRKNLPSRGIYRLMIKRFMMIKNSKMY